MLHRASLSILLAATLLAAPGALAQTEKKPENAGPYVPTPWVIVDEMLKLAGIGPQDFVIDLGSGDGRLVIAAVERYAARGGFGVDIDGELVKRANEAATRAGVGDRVRFEPRDLFETDVSRASVVTLYLLPHIVTKLVPKLLSELKPGSRVVSHDYPLAPWQHDNRIDMEVPEKVNISGTTRTLLFLYTVPAKVAGTWELALPPALARTPLTLAVNQELGQASGTIVSGERRPVVQGLRLKGTAVEISLAPLASGGKPVVLRGTVDGDTMEGSIASSTGAERWHAKRLTP